jgi:DNA-binding NarL/FixJ family response regulator
MISVLIADDQALVRAGFEVLIDTADDLTVVGTAANGAEAVELAVQRRPGVILMDIRMPVLDGLQATAEVLARVEGTRVLMLTTFDLDEYVFGALRAGASGFLLKDTPPADLLAAIRVVAAGDALLSPSITRQLIEEFVRRPPSDRTGGRLPPGRGTSPELTGLTEREVEVLELVARGLSNSEIAQRLYVSPATAKTHVARLLMKLDARDRAQLIIMAYESGLITPQKPVA